MPLIEDLPLLVGDLPAGAKMIIEDGEATKQAPVEVVASRLQLLAAIADRLALITDNDLGGYLGADVDVHSRLRGIAWKAEELRTVDVGLRYDVARRWIDLFGTAGLAAFRALVDVKDPRYLLSIVDEVHNRLAFAAGDREISTAHAGIRSGVDWVELLGSDRKAGMRIITGLDDPSWLFALLDTAHNRLLFGVRADGSLYPAVSGGGGTPALPRLAPLPVVLNRGALRQINKARHAFKRGQPYKLPLGVFGDSFIAGAGRWMQGLVFGTDSLLGRYGDGGAGWVSFVTGNARGSVGNYRLTSPYQTSNAYWSVQRRNAGNIGPDISSITPLQPTGSSGEGLRLDAPTDGSAVPLTSMRLIYNAAAPCQIRYNFSNIGVVPNTTTAWSTVDLMASGGITALAIANLPDYAQWRFRIEIMSGSTPLNGLMLDGPATGVNFSALGVNGSSTGDWINNDAAAWQQGIALLGIKAWFVMLGTNDQAVPNSPATWIANLHILITRLRAVDPSCDICILVPPENFDPGRITTPMAGYEAALRDYCDTHPTVAGLIMQSSVGAAGGDYSATGAFPLWDPDLVHPAPEQAGPLMVQFFLDHIFS